MTKSPLCGLALDDIDPNTQVWSFCCMLWHLLSMGSVLPIRLMYIYYIRISKGLLQLKSLKMYIII